MTSQYPNLRAEAAAFAVRKHAGQVRKGTKWPYVVHPINVAFILRASYPDNEGLEAAGYLHDVLEDTDTTYQELLDRFGPYTTHLVDAVTNRGHWSLKDYEGFPDVLRLKAADTLDNVLDTIRGLEKGHYVWQHFASGERKADIWIKNSELILKWLGEESLALTLHDATIMVKGLQPTPR